MPGFDSAVGELSLNNIFARCTSATEWVVTVGRIADPLLRAMASGFAACLDTYLSEYGGSRECKRSHTAEVLVRHLAGVHLQAHMGDSAAFAAATGRAVHDSFLPAAFAARCVKRADPRSKPKDKWAKKQKKRGPQAAMSAGAGKPAGAGKV